MNATIVMLDARHGSAHPIVARLMLQPDVLMQGFVLDQCTREQINTCLMACARHLLHCHDLESDVCGDIRGIATRIAGEPLQRAGGAIHLPNVGVTLEHRLHDFLESLKNCVRDARELFPLFGMPLIRERGETYVEYANRLEAGEHVAANHPLTNLLRRVEPRLRELLKKRNAKAHPGGWSGTLHIRDFEIHGPVVVPPNWFRGAPPDQFLNANAPTEIATDLPTATALVFNFVELTFVQLLRWHGRGRLIEISEIAEGDRDPARPERFRLQLRHM